MWADLISAVCALVRNCELSVVQTNPEICNPALRWPGARRQLCRDRVTRDARALLRRWAPLHTQLWQEVRAVMPYYERPCFPTPCLLAHWSHCLVLCTQRQEKLDSEILCKENPLLPEAAEHLEEPEELPGAACRATISFRRWSVSSGHSLNPVIYWCVNRIHTFYLLLYTLQIVWKALNVF